MHPQEDSVIQIIKQLGVYVSADVWSENTGGIFKLLVSPKLPFKQFYLQVVSRFILN